jgi:hypothetical protein
VGALRSGPEFADYLQNFLRKMLKAIFIPKNC